MAQHNLRTVVAFEVTRTLGRKKFWLITLLVPAAIAIVIALIVLSNTSVESNSAAQADAELAFTYSDASGYIDPATATAFGGTVVTDDAAANDARLNAGGLIFSAPLPSGAVYERYLGLLATIGTTTVTAGKINAFLSFDQPPAQRAYPDAMPV